MNPNALAGLAALTAITGVLALAQLVSDVFLRDRSRVSDRVDAEFLRKQSARAVRKKSLFKDLGQSAAALSDRDGTTLRQRLEAVVEQSGIDTTVSRVLATSAVAAGVLALLAFAARRSPVDALLAAAVGAVVPPWRIRRARDRRAERLRAPLAAAFDLMARVVRAGQTLGQAVLAVADEFPQPIAGEFALCYEQQNLGLPPEAAFRDLNRRTGVVELKIFVLAVLVQQQTGGNLAELLGKLAAVVRERYLIRGTVRTLTAEGRMQGYILAALPPLMLLLLVVLNRDYAAGHLERPDVLGYTFLVEGFGLLWIRKIVNFDY